MNALASVLLAVVTLTLGFVGGALWSRRRKASVGRPIGPTFADLLHRLVQSSGTGLAVINQYGDVVLHNPRASELELVQLARADARAIKACEQAIETGTALEVDLSPLEHRGRQPEAVVGHVRPLGDGFAVVEAEDTSELVRLEATRRDFVANVSHELKTPVGAVGLLAEALLDAADEPEEVRRFGTKILKESTRLGHLVTELIALSRLTGAERLPELDEVEVDEVVSEALGRSRMVSEATGIGITVDEPSGLKVDGDRTLLVTALSNLVDNAIAYSPPDTPVSVSRRRNGDVVEIAVTDRGIGIAPQHQQRVFERFFRVDPARSRATGGTGLGLAIVKHVAANHGGEVRLWSRPGTGSTFTLRIPAHGAPEPSDPSPGDTAGSTAAPGAAEHNGRISGGVL
ncbi:sensor histidine kinase [Pseudonocardia spinosispora]|uniref:sensor histidine kinase n=1 Tax=Pseudonocardia spinosispora TaxID=103441 RepID=UPI000419EA54|nr:ATP-binding protein [Pseudonocardia spinosispora]